MKLTTPARTIACLMFLALPVACAPVAGPEPEPEMTPVTRWDHRPEARQWTNATLVALKTQGMPLLSTTAADMPVFCPSYGAAGADQRASFWAGLFSAIAKYESTWNPQATGAGGRYLGLMQIAPQTAQAAGCDLSAAGGLHDGTSNLVCAVRIAADAAPEQGLAASVSKVVGAWGPMHDAGKRAEIAAWTRAQAYCR